MNVSDTINAECCIGCGVCTTVCPTGHLKVGMNAYDNLTVTENGEKECRTSCKLCLMVCPFSDLSLNEDALCSKTYQNEDMRYRPECGFYLGSYVGFHPNEQVRLEASSGGLTTYLLTSLLEERKVDAIATVKRNEGVPYFSYTICTTRKEVVSCTGSAYYATQIGDVLCEIKKNKSVKSVAVVALPCFCKAIRNACRVDAMLHRKIKYVVGLVCGQQKTHAFTEYLAAKNGTNPLISIHFRKKKRQRANGNYGVLLNSAQKEKEITFSSYAKEWSFRLFTASACNYCDDIFAETADIVFMDAWLPEYKESDKGENLIITRTAELDDIIKNISSVKPIDIGRVIESQKTVLDNKRTAIVEHLKIATERGVNVPIKRTQLFQPPHLLQRNLIRTKYCLSLASNKMWIDNKKEYISFHQQLRRWKNKLFVGLLLNKIDSVLHKMFFKI